MICGIRQPYQKLFEERVRGRQAYKLCHHTYALVNLRVEVAFFVVNDEVFVVAQIGIL